MQDSAPEVDPSHKVKIVEVIATREYIVDGLVEDRDGSLEFQFQLWKDVSTSNWQQLGTHLSRQKSVVAVRQRTKRRMPP